jgi:hypothetical protein
MVWHGGVPGRGSSAVVARDQHRISIPVSFYRQRLHMCARAFKMLSHGTFSFKLYRVLVCNVLLIVGADHNLKGDHASSDDLYLRPVPSRERWLLWR